MLHSKISFAFLVLCLSGNAPFGYAQEKAHLNTLLAMQQGLATIQKAFSAANSYEFEASLQITLSDEYIKRVPGIDQALRMRAYRVRGVYHEGRGMIRRDLLDDHGGVSSSETFYINKDTVVVKDTEGGNHAVIMRTKGDLEKVMPPRVDAPLLIFGFLQSEIDSHGIRALTMDTLRSTAAWDRVLSAITATNVVMEDEIKLIVERESDFLTVAFSPSPSKGQYWPSMLKVTTKGKAPIAEVTVSEFVSDPTRPGIPKRLKMKTYSPSVDGNNGIHMATWEYDVSKATVGAPIDEDEITFDASSVDQIWDSDARVHINVPR